MVYHVDYYLLKFYEKQWFIYVSLIQLNILFLNTLVYNHRDRTYPFSTKINIKTIEKGKTIFVH
jgi:hypothetical protein